MATSLPALSVQPIQQPDTLGTFGRLLQIKNMQQEARLREGQLALLPGQQQLQQEQLTGAQQQNQIGAANVQLKNLEVKDQQILSQLYPQFTQQTPTNGQPTTPTTGPTGYDFDGLKNAFIKAGGTMAGLSQINAIQGQNADLAIKLATAGQDKIKLEQAKNSAFNDAIESLQAMPDVPTRMQALPGIFSTLNKQGIDTSSLTNITPSDENLAHAQADLGMHQQIIDDATKIAGLQKARQEADPVYKWTSNPQALADPGAQAAIQAQIADPNTEESDKPRLQALLPKAAVAQTNAVVQKQREDQAQQTVSQGDPDSAGKLLASRALTIDELKLRNATPQFMEKAVMAAQKYDPSFKAAEASAQASVAKSPENQQFFGNTDSLLIKGGTLDQLEKRGNDLGNTQIPAYNTVANWVKAAQGKGPQAAYAVAALNVADDFAKVMGGGTASDTGRQQALDIIARNQSPEARQASLQQLRDGVMSQRQGRVGSNPYLRDMYPEPSSAAPSQSFGHKIGDLIVQGGRTFKATAVDQNGKVTAADPQ